MRRGYSPPFFMIDEDLSVFFDADEHAQQCVIIDTQQIITAVFDRPYASALDVQGFSPSLTCKTADTTDMRRGTRIDIDGTTWRVVLLEPDGTGVTRVQLEQAE